MRKTILFTAVLAAAAALPAQAQTAALSQSISTADLDLGTAAGRNRFQHRVGAAIEAVCGSYAGASAAEQDMIGRCRRVARASVETQLASRETRRAQTIQIAASTR